MLKWLFICGAFMLSPSPSMDNNPPINEAEIYKRMLFNCLPAILETYHADDWMDLNDQAAQYWRDPTPILTQTVESRVNILYPVLLKTFLNNENAVKRIMADYFNAQCENLYDHFLENKDRTYSYFRSFPTQYSATLAYESKAVEMGIYLNENYHQLYAIENQRETQRTKLIEDMNQQIAEKERNHKKMKIAITPPPVPSKSMRPLAKGYIPKTKSKTPTNISSQDSIKQLLEDIRKGEFKLKHVEAEPFSNYRDPNSLAEILKSGLKRIHRGTHGAYKTYGSHPDEMEEHIW